jgi:hypothetical protein
VGAAVVAAEGIVNTQADLEAALYCAAEVVRSRQQGGRPVPGWLRHHLARREREFQMSQLRRENDCDSGQDGQSSDDDWMGNADVAEYLHLSTRQVQRLRKAGKLVGVQVSGGWIFRRSTVIEYARRRDSDRYTDGSGDVAVAHARARVANVGRASA